MANDMSDRWNPASETQTPHGKAASFNSQRDGDDFSSTDYAKLYDRGIALFKQAGFTFVRSPSGSHCGHKVYRRVSPKEAAGLTYPHWFKYLRLVESVEDETALSSAMLRGTDAAIDLQQFWSPVTQPMSGVKSSPLQGYVERLQKIDASHLAQNESEPIDLGVQFSDFSEANAKRYRTPRAYVPPRDWFDPVLHDVTFRDIFTLWPKAETEMLQLVLGRALAGRSGSLPVGTDKVLEHTYRSVAIIVGEDAGMGKSTIFEMLFKALNRVGYCRVNFRDVGERFGIGDVAESDIAYKDDVTGRTLANLISSENTKIIASGGSMTSEDKFQKAATVVSRTVLIANTNVWDPRSVYNLDPGVVDRIKLLSTYRRNELTRAGLAETSAIANDSPNFAPFIHIAWLAGKLGVSQDALMLWASRLAVDEFVKYTFWRGEVPTEALRLRIHDVSSRLQYSFNKDSTKAIVSCMLFSHVFMSHLTNVSTARKSFEWRELNETILSECFRDFRAVATDEGMYRLRSVLKLHWELNGRPETHPWAGLRKLNFLSVRSAYAELANSVSRKAPLPDLVKGTFEQLTLRDGFKGSSDIVWVTSAWQACRGYMEDIEQLARTCMNIVLDNSEAGQQMHTVFDRLGMLARGTVNDSWLDSPSYTPKSVSSLMPQDIGMDIDQFTEQLATSPWLS